MVNAIHREVINDAFYSYSLPFIPIRFGKINWGGVTKEHIEIPLTSTK